MFGISWEHFGPVCLLLILGSQALNRRAQRLRWRKEERSLRVGLHVGLRSIGLLYSENLRAIGNSKGGFASGRNQINLLKTQLNRLAILDEREVEAIMSACIAAERAESTLEAARRAMAAESVTVLRREERRATAVAAMREACSALSYAETLLGGGDTGDALKRGDARSELARSVDRIEEVDSKLQETRLKAASP